jgi:hypothetical protein
MGEKNKPQDMKQRLKLWAIVTGTALLFFPGGILPGAAFLIAGGVGSK